MSKKSKKAEAEYVWRVEKAKDGGIALAFGAELSAMPISDGAKLNVLGRALIGLGTQLMNSTTGDSDDDWDEGE